MKADSRFTTSIQKFGQWGGENAHLVAAVAIVVTAASAVTYRIVGLTHDVQKGRELTKQAVRVALHQGEARIANRLFEASMAEEFNNGEEMLWSSAREATHQTTILDVLICGVLLNHLVSIQCSAACSCSQRFVS